MVGRELKYCQTLTDRVIVLVHGQDGRLLQASLLSIQNTLKKQRTQSGLLHSLESRAISSSMVAGWKMVN